MTRARIALAPALCGLLACATNSGPSTDTADERMSAYVGGWDGDATRGSSVLLLRDGLIGTLSAANLVGEDVEYQVSFDVNGDAVEDSVDDVLLSLSCSEVLTRPMLAAADTDAADDQEPAEAPEEPQWSSVDCAGWEIELQCGLAGECAGGDCNMVCDIVYFGDAFATATVTLSGVEDEFDHWQRV